MECVIIEKHCFYFLLGVVGFRSLCLIFGMDRAKHFLSIFNLIR